MILLIFVNKKFFQQNPSIYGNKKKPVMHEVSRWRFRHNNWNSFSSSCPKTIRSQSFLCFPVMRNAIHVKGFGELNCMIVYGDANKKMPSDIGGIWLWDIQFVPICSEFGFAGSHKSLKILSKASSNSTIFLSAYAISKSNPHGAINVWTSRQCCGYSDRGFVVLTHQMPWMIN
jgi:hypothetical protein